MEESFLSMNSMRRFHFIKTNSAMSEIRRSRLHSHGLFRWRTRAGLREPVKLVSTGSFARERASELVGKCNFSCPRITLFWPIVGWSFPLENEACKEMFCRRRGNFFGEF